jgi:hypothetical protein
MDRISAELFQPLHADQAARLTGGATAPSQPEPQTWYPAACFTNDGQVLTDYLLD